MNPEFWHQCWQEGRTGWQLPKPHSFLEQFGSKVFASAQKVLIPLCGASPDVGWFLSRGFSVVGIELVETAVIRLFEPLGQPYKVERSAIGPVYRGERLEIYVADYFTIPAKYFSECDAHYDRAAIIAMPPSRQQDYVEQLRVMAPHLKLSVWIGLTHDGGPDAGPPFSTPYEVLTSYCNAQWQLLTQAPVALGKSNAEAGVGQLPKFAPSTVMEYMATCWWR